MMVRAAMVRARGANKEGNVGEKEEEVEEKKVIWREKEEECDEDKKK